MKICLVSHSFLPTIGGAELVVHHLASHLSKMGAEVVVFTHKRKVVSHFVTNYRIAYYPRTPEKFFRFLQGYIFMPYLFFLNMKEKFDIINFHVAKMSFYALKIKGIVGTPMIVTTHGGDIQKYPAINYGERLDPFWGSKIEYSIRKADLLTAIGSSTHREYKAIGAQNKNIADIPNGVDISRFKAEYKDVREHFNFDDNTKLILSVGRYHIKKGYEYLVKAMPQIVSRYENIKCLLVGKRLKTLEPLIKNLGMEEFVFLVEEQKYDFSDSLVGNAIIMPNDFLFYLYKSCDVYVSSSLIEGFALTIIEAMAAGLPIVATNVEGNEDAVHDGANGFLVPPKRPDAIAERVVELLENNTLRTIFGKKSEELSTKYDWNKIAHQYLTSYKKLKENYG